MGAFEYVGSERAAFLLREILNVAEFPFPEKTLVIGVGLPAAAR